MVGGQGRDGGNERDDESQRKASVNNRGKQADGRGAESAERGQIQGQLPCSPNHVKLQLNAAGFAQCLIFHQ